MAQLARDAYWHAITNAQLTAEERINYMTADYPDIPELSPEWHQRQIDVHAKWAGGPLPQVVVKRIQAAAHCMVLREHCGKDCRVDFSTKPPYASRGFMAGPGTLDCPKTLAELKAKTQCLVKPGRNHFNVAVED
jgi:hypothetical protein